jgi:hypothetical protein
VTGVIHEFSSPLSAFSDQAHFKQELLSISIFRFEYWKTNYINEPDLERKRLRNLKPEANVMVKTEQISSKFSKTHL